MDNSGHGLLLDWMRWAVLLGYEYKLPTWSTKDFGIHICHPYSQLRKLRVHAYIIQGVSSLRSLSPCTCVEVLDGMDDIIIMHCTCTVLYCTCSDFQFMFILLACYIIV